MKEGDIFSTKHNGDLEIVEYINHKKVLVRFVSTGYETKVQKENITSGYVRDKLHPRRFGVGYEGVGDFRLSIGGKVTDAANHWKHMLERCYCEKYLSKHPTYTDCEVVGSWHNYQNFAKWFYENLQSDYEEVSYHLDKDTKIKGNKMYGPDFCSMIKSEENIAFSHMKSYTFLNPKGEVVKLSNLTDFCRNKNLTRENMGKVFRGERPSHKGWTLYIGES